MTAVVQVRGLSRRYRKVTALDNVSFDLHENVVHGLLGRNGAGKTTLMRLLTAQAFPTSGTVEVFGAKPYENESVQQRMCFVGEGQKYPNGFTVRNVLRAGELLYPNWDDGVAYDLVVEFGLPLRRSVTKLSRGMLSALGIVVGLAARAPLTLFDEPYSGLDAVARQLFYDRLLADYLLHPRTVLLSTHLIDEVGDLLERVVVLDKGRVLLDDDADALRSRSVTVVGPQHLVDGFVAGRGSLHRQQLASFVRVTLSDPITTEDRARARAAGLDLEPVSLQQLVVLSTGSHSRAAVLSPTADVMEALV